MPTTLTAPVTVQATTVTLDSWELRIVRTPALAVDAGQSYFGAEFVLRRADGVVLERRGLTRQGDALPANVRTAIANLQNVLVTAARAAGIIPAGADTPDFP